MKKRMAAICVTLVLLLTEVMIALFVHDRFIRPYVGDILVVIVIYAFLKIFVLKPCPWLPGGVFLFAALVEGLQAMHIVELLGVANNPFLRVLIGSVFDWKDILCYGIGCLFLFGFEIAIGKRHKS